MVRSIKRVPGTPRDLVIDSKLSPWNDCTRVAVVSSQNLISIYSPLLVTPVFSWSNKESKLKGI